MGKAQPVKDYTALISAMPERERSNQRAWTDVIKKVHSTHLKLHKSCQLCSQLISAVREMKMAGACKLYMEAIGIHGMSQASLFGTLSHSYAKICRYQLNVRESILVHSPSVWLCPSASYIISV